MRDLNDVLDLTLRLPIGGKVYEVQPPPAAIGAELMNRLALGIYAEAGLPITDEIRGAIEVSDDDLPDFARMCLGENYDEMVDAGLDGSRIEFCVTTAFYAWTVGKDFAEHYWETAGKPAGASLRVTPPTETRTLPAVASTTRSSGSRSGTRTRKASSRRASP